MSWIALVAGLAMILAGSCLEAQSGGVIGDWRDPGGSVIRIDQCGGDVCLWLISISKSAPATTDVHNPDPGERSRALCGLKIGRGFSLRDPEHATDGTLYDPKSGKTYRGTITAEGALFRCEATSACRCSEDRKPGRSRSNL